MQINFLPLKSKHDIDGALNKYKRIPQIQMEGGDLWSNIGMCFFKKRKYVAVSALDILLFAPIILIYYINFVPTLKLVKYFI